MERKMKSKTKDGDSATRGVISPDVWAGRNGGGGGRIAECDRPDPSGTGEQSSTK